MRHSICIQLLAMCMLARGSAPPNIVWLMSDDLGYGELSSFGQTQFRTPHIDRLASEGVRFTSAYCGEAVCAPSRGALMTGLHMGHAYIRGNGKKGIGGTDTPLRPGDTTVAELLQQAGYYTGLVGKWGLGVNGTTGSAQNKGFNYFFGEPDQTHAHNMYPEFLLQSSEAVAGRLEEIALTGNTRQEIQGVPAFASSLLHAQSGLCLGATGRAAEGDPLRVQSCVWGIDTRQWLLDEASGVLVYDGVVSSPSPSLCAAANGENGEVVLAACDRASPAQQWVLTAQQQLSSGTGARPVCMQAVLSPGDEAAAVTTMPCVSPAVEVGAQTFRFLNPIPSRERCMSPQDQYGNFGGCNYTHDLFTDHAVAFLEERARVPDQPFFLYVAWTDPHAGGWGSDVEHGNPVPFDGQFNSEHSWPVVERDHASVIQNVQDRGEYNTVSVSVVFMADKKCICADVGRILRTLQTTGMDNNTIVFFASDNGASDEGGHRASFFTSSGPLRGVKRSLYEGGIRTPSSARWPGVIPPAQVSAFPWTFADFLPTALELASRPDLVPPGLDGISIVPTLLGQPQSRGDFCLYWEFCTNDLWGRAARRGRWKAVALSSAGPTELYDLERDIGETTDLAARFPAVVREMEACMDAEHEDSPDWPVGDGLCVSS